MLFFLVYIFLVVFFLPTFYKKFRFRFFFKLKNEFFGIFHFVVLLDSLFVSVRLAGYFIASLSRLLSKFFVSKHAFVALWFRKVNNLLTGRVIFTREAGSFGFVSSMIGVARHEGLFFLR